MKRQRKRRRDEIVQRVVPERPITKTLLNVVKTVTTTQAEETLFTTTFPCTVTGLRWNIGYTNTTPSAAGRTYWLIVVVEEGNNASTVAITNGSSLYKPESNVVAFGHFRGSDADSGAGPTNVSFSGKSKAMRKLMSGDTLQFIVVGNVANQGNFSAVVQFFCRF